MNLNIKFKRRSNSLKNWTITIGLIYLISLGYIVPLNFSLNLDKNLGILKDLRLQTNNSTHSAEWLKSWDFSQYDIIDVDEDGNELRIYFHEKSGSIAVNQDGNHIIASGYLGYCSIGNTEGNAFIVKLNDHGDYFWNKTLGTPQAIPVKLLFGSDNNSYILITSTWGMLCDQFDYTIFKLDKEGNLLSESPLSYPKSASSMTIDSNENIYVIGHKYGEMFISKYNQLGNFIWNIYYNESALSFDIERDSQDNIFAISENSFMKLNSDGNLLWRLNLSGGRKIRIDRNDRIYILTNSDLIKFDEDGNELWNISTNSLLIELDKENNIYLLEINELIKLDSNGTKEFILSDNHINAFYIDSETNIYTTGILNGDFIVKKYGMDRDHDNLTDWVETNIYFTNPDDYDSDGDNLSDGEEVQTYFTDPNNEDTDGDGYFDGIEVELGTDPLDPNDYPKKKGYTVGINQQGFFISLVCIIVIGMLVIIFVKSKKKFRILSE
ncbi:hypothetical protein LCGC14_1934510 [marine sediment metagenome]|uniref:Bulb-type lectin domain-containing protein n=1 Tax=marine sediment metagenome TaxID=412755 RepID=A0A0F9IJN2_9ZZZZ